MVRSKLKNLLILLPFSHPVIGSADDNRLGLAPLSDHLSGLRRRRVAQFYGSYHSKSNKYNRLAHKMHAQRFMTLCIARIQLRLGAPHPFLVPGVARDCTARKSTVLWISFRLPWRQSISSFLPALSAKGSDHFSIRRAAKITFTLVVAYLPRAVPNLLLWGQPLEPLVVGAGEHEEVVKFLQGCSRFPCGCRPHPNPQTACRRRG